MEAAYTERQGQYLAFVYYYIKIHGVPPAEADFRRYVMISPPATHEMIVTSDKGDSVTTSPVSDRSIGLRLSRDQSPDLLSRRCRSKDAPAAGRLSHES